MAADPSVWEQLRDWLRPERPKRLQPGLRLSRANSLLTTESSGLTMPSLPMAWMDIYITVWIYIPNRLIKLMPFSSSNIIIFSPTVQTPAFCTYANAEMHTTFEMLYVWRAKEPDTTTTKTRSPGDLTLQTALAAVSSTLASRTTSKHSRLIQTHRLFQPGPQSSPAFSHHTETGQPMIHLAILGHSKYP